MPKTMEILERPLIRFPVKLTPEEHEILYMQAAREGQTLNDLVGDIINRHISRRVRSQRAVARLRATK